MSRSDGVGMAPVLALYCLVCAFPFSAKLRAQEAHAQDRQVAEAQSTAYRLGPGDQVKIWVLGLDEIGAGPIRIGGTGFLDLPILGRMKAGGLTVEELRAELLQAARREVREPRVSVEVAEFGSQPVSVLGAVNQPGVQQIKGRKTLVELLSGAGGLRADAGHSLKVTRLIASGDDLALPSSREDETHSYRVAEIEIDDIMSAREPRANILVRSGDVVTVPVAEMIYVVGAVKKSGGFVLRDREKMSALQALSVAEGLGTASAPSRAQIIRNSDSGQKQRIPINMSLILSGKNADVPLQANDILFIPESTEKKAAVRALEAAVQLGTGVVIYRR